MGCMEGYAWWVQMMLQSRGEALHRSQVLGKRIRRLDDQLRHFWLLVLQVCGQSPDCCACAGAEIEVAKLRSLCEETALRQLAKWRPGLEKIRGGVIQKIRFARGAIVQVFRTSEIHAVARKSLRQIGHGFGRIFDKFTSLNSFQSFLRKIT